MENHRLPRKGGGLCRLAGWFPLLMAIYAVNFAALKLRGELSIKR